MVLNRYNHIASSSGICEPFPAMGERADARGIKAIILYYIITYIYMAIVPYVMQVMNHS